MASSIAQLIAESGRIPRHVAIFIDGNGRWASSKGQPRPNGHVWGFEAMADIGFIAMEMKIEYLTLFMLSQENFRRPQDELSNILELWKRYVKEVVPRLHERNIRFKFIGDPKFFDDETVLYIEQGQRMTENNSGTTVAISAAYGGRWDIVTSVQKFLTTAPGAHTISEEEIGRHLSTHFAPDPDLVIRPGGEQRMSNCWIWQTAFSELYFTETLWPDFGRTDLYEALLAFQKRERRYGRASAVSV
jgi:undecaprenyl diphosphate synthase